jgi:surface antigen
MAASLTFSPDPAAARSRHATHGGSAHGHYASGRALVSYGKHSRYARSWGGLQCVPFARNASGVELVGNAWTWWDEAAGIYERGSTPEPGSVLAFRSNGAMRLGHVAVVSRVVNTREIEIDHANWASRGAVSRNVSVVDVSPGNDWTAVRVGLGQSDDFGSIYPTYGFIYARPDDGRHTVVASAAPPAHAAPEAGLRGGLLEVAEAPAHGRGLDLTVPGIAIDAPNRALQ